MKAEAAWLKDPADLRQSDVMVLYMLKDLVGKNEIEGLVVERNAVELTSWYQAEKLLMLIQLYVHSECVEPQFSELEYSFTPATAEIKNRRLAPHAVAQFIENQSLV